MARYFADIKNGIVARVLVCDTLEWLVSNLGGDWKETFMDTPGKRYAGIGYSYHIDVDKFSTPQPYLSWNLDVNKEWQPPIKEPLDGISSWDEETKSWIVNPQPIEQGVM